VFWPAGASGFDLQWVSDLQLLPGGWQSVSNNIVTNGSLKIYQIPIDPGLPACFYRLHTP
jgi:hypothetical protein